MQITHNPFNPGAGTPPPTLAGRDTVRENLHNCIERLRIGRHSNGQLLIGLRGVGKTVLLERMVYDTEQQGAITVHLKMSESKSLPALLAPALRVALLRMSREQAAKKKVIRGLRTLAGFVSHDKSIHSGLNVFAGYTPKFGMATSGGLESDLKDLLVETGHATRAAHTVLSIFIDDLHCMLPQDMTAMLYALHRCGQLQLPVILVGAGLPELRAQIGNAKGYAERMFEVTDLERRPVFA
ncbi:ATP-binding protein [Pandoraea pneumonica]|uniref:ATP-binding protein n=1 Tax=Pandoraea pneumonica TaxID=2508299 RepID=UPI003CF08C18